MAAHTPRIFVLWDDSQIWGLLAARAVKAMRVPHKLVRASDIAGGLLERQNPAILLVPGGNARHKSLHLGEQGLAAVRTYVAQGGRYLGFCGGAGLALSWSGTAEGLGICAWERARFDDRLQHFMSGHLHVEIPAAARPSPLIPGALPPDPRLPVWWPGRFAPQPNRGITVLASYRRPADDFWLSDLPIADLPPDIFTAWNDLYGLALTPTYLAGQPCLVHGCYGRGEYVLSYSHLETPQSPEANRWFGHILATLGNIPSEGGVIPAWEGRASNTAWDDPGLSGMRADLDAVLETGLKHGLLFRRTDWLFGWRAGIPGANLNNLRAALGAVLEHEPGPAALAFWRRQGERMCRAMNLFSRGCMQYLLAERLSLTLSKTLPDAVPPELLKDQRDSLFGPPMHAGGVYREIMEPLDELAYLQCAGL